VFNHRGTFISKNYILKCNEEIKTINKLRKIINHKRNSKLEDPISRNKTISSKGNTINVL